jgi:hypothetical protein
MTGSAVARYRTAEYVNPTPAIPAICWMTTESGGAEVGVPDRAIRKWMPRAGSKEGPHVDVFHTVLSIKPMPRCTLTERQQHEAIAIERRDRCPRKRALHRGHGQIANLFEVGRAEGLGRPLAHLNQHALLPLTCGEPAATATFAQAV